MTKKRFINDIDIGQLIDTKGELSTIDYSDKVDFYELWEFLNKLNDENEELKQFKEKVFSLFDKEIARNEEAIEWGKETGADSGSMGFYNHMLKRLKKELE